MKKIKFKEILQINKIHEDISIPHLILPSHIILTLYLLYYNESASRKVVSNFLSLPMARTRKLLNILEKTGLIIKFSGRKGTKLTEKGSKLCDTLVSYFKILKLFESVDLGSSVLGTTNAMAGIPLNLLTKPINVVELRDISLKIGALGASIFEVSLTDENKLQIYFIDDINHSNLISFPDCETIRQLITEPIIENRKWLFIASTIQKLPVFYFNPLFDNNKNIPSFTIVLLASVQTLWELIKKEIF